MACYRDRVLTIDPRSNSDGCTRLCRHVQRGNVINPRGKIQTKTSLPLSSCGYDLTPRLVETISIGSWIERFQDLVPSRARDDRRFGEGRKNVIEQCRTILSLSSAASSRCNAPMVPNLAWLVSTNASRQRSTGFPVSRERDSCRTKLPALQENLPFQRKGRRSHKLL